MTVSTFGSAIKAFGQIQNAAGAPRTEEHAKEAMAKKPVLEELARLFTLSQNGYGTHSAASFAITKREDQAVPKKRVRRKSCAELHRHTLVHNAFGKPPQFGIQNFLGTVVEAQRFG